MNDHALLIATGGVADQHLVRSLLFHGEKVIAVYRQTRDTDMTGAEAVVNESTELKQH